MQTKTIPLLDQGQARNRSVLVRGLPLDASTPTILRVSANDHVRAGAELELSSGRHKGARARMVDRRRR